jgi:hypothetical protein
MKRLVDESSDELTRALLRAGIEDGPPPGNKAHVIVALGAGSALGLFSSNAFAWLGSTAGKVTAAGVAVGMAGAVFIAAPRWGGDADVSSGAPRASAGQARVNAGVEAAPEVPPAVAPEMAPAVAVQAPAGELGAPPTGTVGSSSEGLGSGAASAPSAGETKLGGSQAKRLERRQKKLAAAKKRGEARRAASEASAAAPLAEARSSAEVSLSPGESPVAAHEASAAAGSALDTEVRLVDDMHWAARRNDRVALARFVEAYRESFPRGQLQKEVAEFAARLERADGL